MSINLIAFIFVGGAIAVAFVVTVALCYVADEADDHADDCYRDTQEQRTRHILNTVRRQQSRRSLLDRHLIISQMVRPWRRSPGVDEDFEDLGASG